MASVYFKNRQQAAEQAIPAFAHLRGKPVAVVSLSTDSLTIGAMLANSLLCPLQLYLSADIEVPGGLLVGSVDDSGGFSYDSGLSHSEADYYYQQFRGYIDDAKRQAFSSISRELGTKTVIRKDLLRGCHIVVVDDCMADAAALNSFVNYLRPIAYQQLHVCSPIVATSIVSRIQQISGSYYFAGNVDFFYGKDHYFEDNTVWQRAQAIEIVSNTLKLWPPRQA